MGTDTGPMTLQVDHTLDRSVTISAGDIELLTYIYRPQTAQLESPKPYLHPIRTTAGDLVSLFRPHDHIWHKGISWALPHVGEHNFWGGPTYVHGSFYVQLPNNGSALHRRMTALEVRDGAASLAHELDWITQSGDLLLTEQRVLHMTMLDDSSWVLVFDTAMTNVSGGALAFGSPTTKGRENAGYGGLFWRGPRSFTDGLLQTPEKTGGDDVRGTRAAWLAFRGRHDESGRSSTVVMVDDAANPQHPPQWFARTEQFACLNPAPFFSEELHLADHNTLHLRYAVVVATGDHGDDGTTVLAERGRTTLAATARPS